jgi:hypothetical protein
MNIKKSMYYITILSIIFSFSNCDNDDGNAPNQNTCNYQGLTFLNTTKATTTLIAESDLFTDFFNTSSNGPEVEIYETNNPGNFNFTTTTVNLNGTGTAILNYNGTTYTVDVTCQRIGNAIGQEIRFDLTASGLEAELCVQIDDFH